MKATLLLLSLVSYGYSWHENSLVGLRVYEKWLKRAFLTAATAVQLTAVGPLQIAHAESWDDRNRLAAEVWRTADELYLDRTFNGQDWFKLRQSVVKRTYNSDLDVYTAVQTMLSKLGDKYTRFLTPAQYDALLSTAQGSDLIGLGVELSLAADGHTTEIIRIQEGSPAEAAGVQKGDLIVNVEGQDASTLSPEEVAALLRGKLNTKVNLRIQRAGESKPFDLSAERKAIKVPLISSTILKAPPPLAGVDSILAIRIRAFSSNTAAEVADALLKSESSSDRLILVDLRGNGGGLLQGAIETAGLFLAPGKIVVFQVGKDGLAETKGVLPASTGNGAIAADMKSPMLILVDGDTASAAEVFSAALQEAGRAILAGQKTFGKGVIQTLTPLRQGGMAVTIARYETPLHHDINKVGIPPNVVIECKEPLEKVDACLTKIPSADIKQLLSSNKKY